MQLTPAHVAIIMDGNGRWATQRGLPRPSGHRQGASAVRRVVEFAALRQIGELTLFAFSSDNWHRPATETAVLMSLFERFLRKELRNCLEKGIVIDVIGRRDRLSHSLRQAIEHAERLTAKGQGMLLRIAVDYSSRWGLSAMATHTCSDGIPIQSDAEGARTSSLGLPGRKVSVLRHGQSEPLRERLATLMHAARPVSDVDLLIRSGGERRLSDFLLLECAYAELHFTDVLWPDFAAADLDAALGEFARRDRRFGSLATPEEPSVPGAGATA